MVTSSHDLIPTLVLTSRFGTFLVHKECTKNVFVMNVPYQMVQDNNLNHYNILYIYIYILSSCLCKTNFYIVH